jgi:hypothetical protein
MPIDERYSKYIGKEVHVTTHGLGFCFYSNSGPSVSLVLKGKLEKITKKDLIFSKAKYLNSCTHLEEKLFKSLEVPIEEVRSIGEM